MSLLQKASSRHVFMTNDTPQHSEKSAHDRAKKEPVFFEHFHEKEIWFYERDLLFQKQNDTRRWS